MATERVKYLGKRELTIKEFEALDTLNPNIDYNLTDFPQFYITNEQMTFALTCKRLFNIGSTFICADEGNYSKGHIYQITGSPKTWEDITPLKDVAKLDEQNIFTSENTFKEHTQFDKGLNSDGDISVTNKVVKVIDNTQNGDGTNKDIVTQYAADEIVIEKGDAGNSNKVNITLPTTSGTLASTKHSVIKNDDTTIGAEINKEDTWLIGDEDATISIGYRNGGTHASLSASRGFVEISNVDSIGASKLTATASAITIEAQGTEEGDSMLFEATKDDMTINKKSIEQRYLDLTGDAGTLDDGKYELVTKYDDLIIRIAGISYRQSSKPHNGSGDYTFVSTYYAKPNGTEDFDAYIVTIKTDKSWKITIKNFLQIGQQTYAPFIEISPMTAVNGNLSDDDFTNLTEHDDVYIKLNNEYYYLADSGHTPGIRSYTHNGWNGNQAQDKSINITLETKAWTLAIGQIDTSPTKDSTNPITSGGVYNSLQQLKQSYEQSEADNAVIIRNGNIVKQMVTFTITGNSEKIWSFPYSYDADKKPMCWCNSVAEGNSVSNGAAVISWSNTSMTVRNCGIDSEITFYAEGWIS